jgi:hypothetical protein
MGSCENADSDNNEQWFQTDSIALLYGALKHKGRQIKQTKIKRNNIN